MLQRMRELAVQSANGTLNSSTQRAYLQTEFAALTTQIGKIASDTTWNGTQILNTATSFTYQAGMNSGQTIVVAVATGATLAALMGTAATSIATPTGASASLDMLDNAISAVNTQRASFGAAINQMTYAVDNMQNISTNISASRSSIMDTDYAAASSQLSKTQIIQQASTAMLAQANQQPQSVLSLLK